VVRPAAKPSLLNRRTQGYILAITVCERLAQPLVGLLFVFACAIYSTPEGKGVWAVRGVHFRTHCLSDEVADCKPVDVPSPDKRNVASIYYRKVLFSDGDYALGAFVHVSRNDGAPTDFIPGGQVENELLWSPDSTGLIDTGSNSNPGPQFVELYRLSDSELRPMRITDAAQRDMLQILAPCKAKNASPQDCALLVQHPESVNVIAIDWTPDSKGIVVMAEIPCYRQYGGIMCAILGYELEVPSGKILRRMEPKEFATRWKDSIAWDFEAPDPPEFEKPNRQ
jgi:hypothetical protein